MNENNSISMVSGDGFVTHSTQDMYSVYTGFTFSRRYLPVSFRKSCCKVVESFPKFAKILLTNVVVSVFAIVVVLGLSLGLGLYAFLRLEPHPAVDYSLKSFSIPNHEVTLHQEAFDTARDELKKSRGNIRRRRRSVSGSEDVAVRRYKRYAAQYIPCHKVLLVHLAVNGDSDNIFTRERIEMIHRIETEVVTMPGFSELCYKGMPKLGIQHCKALNSLVSKYFYRSSPDSSDLSDSLVSDFHAAVIKALSSSSGFLYTDGHATRNNLKSTFLRSEISFGMPLPGRLCNISTCLLSLDREGMILVLHK